MHTVPPSTHPSIHPGKVVFSRLGGWVIVPLWDIGGLTLLTLVQDGT